MNPKSKGRIQTAKKILNKYRFSNYLEGLLYHWQNNPPVVGHGFYHSIDCAVNAHKLAKLNGSKPDHAFLAGLYHDIYRPARGEYGEEDQTKGASFVKQIFSDHILDKDYLTDIVQTIITHDNWRNDKKPPTIPLLISFADKMSHDYLIVYTYAWSSNKNLKKEAKEKRYKSHFDVLSDFVRYQIRAWEVFRNFKSKVKGSNESISAYIEIYKVLIENYKTNTDQGDFQNYLKKVVMEAKQKETYYLKKFTDDNKQISSIIENYQIVK